MMYSVIQRKCQYGENSIHVISFRMKLFVRGSGARYEGPRHIESLETFYQQKVKEDENVCDHLGYFNRRFRCHLV